MIASIGGTNASLLTKIHLIDLRVNLYRLFHVADTW